MTATSRRFLQDGEGTAYMPAVAPLSPPHPPLLPPPPSLPPLPSIPALMLPLPPRSPSPPPPSWRRPPPYSRLLPPPSPYSCRPEPPAYYSYYYSPPPSFCVRWPPPSPSSYHYPYRTSPPPTSVDTKVLLVLAASAVFLLPFVIATFACSRFSCRAASDHMNGGHNHSTASDLPPGRSFIHKLPILPFSADHLCIANPEVHSQGTLKNKPQNTCAICISDYQQGELLKLLPACGHFFHKYCIDMWLFSHSTCPLCRLSLFNHTGDLILQLTNVSVQSSPCHIDHSQGASIINA
ncbi:hypothetical protein L7F22_058698 [Adiantum nelumboides]|nr:hypothetical protein [Adiantum nelumboides]